MSILFAGSPENAAIVLAQLLEAGVEVSVVLTRADSPQGRKRVFQHTPVAEVAMRHSLPTIKSNIVDESVVAELSRYQVDAAIVVAFGVLLKQSAIDAIPDGWFNLHFSMLPKYRGAAPVQRALMNGEVETGVTLFKIDAGLDTGPVLASLPVTVSPDETATELLSRLSLLGATLVTECLPRIYSGFAALETQVGEATFAPKLQREDAFLSFRESRTETFNRYRAVTVEPGAWALLEGTPIKILGLKITGVDLGLEPGTFEMRDSRVLVQCSDGALEIQMIQPSGKGPMNASDWSRGFRGSNRFEG